MSTLQSPTGLIPQIVLNGGTGNATQPAYSLVTGGTTATGPFQAVNPDLVGKVLVSNGVAALPSFSATPSVTSITFGAGSALSDYSTNTFTPTLEFGGASVGITYVINIGKYWKIGNVVFFTVNLVLSNKGSSVGTATLVGFPFTAANDGFRNTWCCETNISFPTLFGNNIMILECRPNTTVFPISYCNNAIQQSLSNTAFTNSTTLFVSGFYWTA